MNNNIICNNKSLDQGGGVFVETGCSAEINNTTIVNNYSNIGGGIYFSDNAYLDIVNNIIWKNRNGQIYFEKMQPSVSYTNIMGGFSGTGNIDADPRFVDAASNDYHLLYGSPCMNAGDNSVSMSVDFEGDPRYVYGNVDIGADEFHPHIYFTGDATPSGQVEMKFIGLPGTQINALLRSFNVYESPIPCDYGSWYLGAPINIITGLGHISSDGTAYLVGEIPNRPAPLYEVYIQAVIDYQLTNLCTLRILEK
jgi:hypothetical protein